MKEGSIGYVSSADFQDIRVSEMGIGPFVEKYRLSDVLVDDYALRQNRDG